MVRSLLLRYGGNEYDRAALDVAKNLAESLHARILGISVLDESSLGENPQAVQTLEETKREALIGLEKQCEEWGVECRTSLLVGDFVEEISIEGEKTDLIILGAPPLEHAGENDARADAARKAIKQSKKPVFVVRPGHEQIKKILIGCDGSSRAGHALEIVAIIAEKLGAEILLLNVSSDPAKGGPILSSAKGYLENYNVNSTSMLIEGDPAEVILDVAEVRNCDLIAIGATGHGTIKDLLFGSTATTLVDNAHSSLLVYW
ncbi:MAG: universal stress protein [Planctomycetes bacterium]|nr:universal stress protein [Planctomycetota bacterium]